MSLMTLGDVGKKQLYVHFERSSASNQKPPKNL